MKYLKMLGLAAIAAMALMAVGAGTASATVLCTTTDTPSCTMPYGAGTKIHATLKAGTSGVLEEVGTNNVLDTCTTSTLESEITNAGGAAATVSGPNKVLTWGSATTTCTHPTTTSALGTLEIHYIAGTHNGTVIAHNTSVAISGLFGVTCTYESGATKDLGTLVGGNLATININVLVPGNAKNSFLCPPEGRWTAEYTVTSVNGVAEGLYVTES